MNHASLPLRLVAVVVLFGGPRPALAETATGVAAVNGVEVAAGADAAALVVGSEESYPPFATGGANEAPSGFTVDLWRAVAGECGLPYTIRVATFHQILSEFKEGKIDVLINLARSDERRQFASFTVPHVTVHGAVFVRKGQRGINSESDLEGKSIVVIKADLAQDYAIAKGWQKQLTVVETALDGLKLLSSGSHDAMLVGKLAGMQTLQSAGITNVRPLDARAGFSQSFAFAVHPGHSALLARLNEGLALVKSNGTYDALYEKWFGVYEVREPTLREKLRYLVPPSLVGLSLAIFFGYRRRVDRTLRARAAEELRLSVATIEAVRASEQRYRALTANAPVGIFENDANGNRLFSNDRWLELSGLSAAAALGQGWRRAVHPDDLDAVLKEWAAAMQEQREFFAEFRLVRPAGVVFVASRAVALKNAAGQVTGYLGTTVDLTEMKQIQGRLAFNNHMASLGTLAAGVAHEINNPLAYLTINLELIIEHFERHPQRGHDDHDIEIEQMATEARDGARRVAQIVRGLKSFSRADNEERSPVELSRVLDTAVSMTFHEVRPRARLDKDYARSPLIVAANESRLVQVFVNLIVNAAQSFADGQLDRNLIRLVTRLDAVGRAVVEVADSGPGIAPADLGRIFDPFFTTRGVGGGTGLGLSICHGIVSAMGGEIAVESERGVGSVFRVALPLASAARGDEPAATSPSPPPTQRRARVLIVDDEVLVARALGRILSDHDVTAALSAKEALAHLVSGQPFDVVLCDLMMPEMTGMELYDELSRTAPERAAKMIFVTGGAYTPEARAFLERVPNRRMEKPVDPALLRALLDGAVA